MTPAMAEGRLQLDSNTKGKKRALPYDRSFGSFFGPSKPVVAKRILDEAAARKVSEMVAARAAKQAQVEQIATKRPSLSSAVPSSRSASTSKPGERRVSTPVKPINEVALKAQQLKEARDYSFLFSDAPSKAPDKSSQAPKPGLRAHLEGTKKVVGERQSSEQHRTAASTKDASSRSSKPLKLVNTSKSRVPSSSNLHQQNKFRQSHTPEMERSKSDQRLKSSGASQPSSYNKPVKSQQSLASDKLKRPDVSNLVRGHSKPLPTKVISGPGPPLRVEASEGLRRSTTGSNTASARSSLRDERKGYAQVQGSGVQKRVPTNALYRPASVGGAQVRQQSETSRQGVQAKHFKAPIKPGPLRPNKLRKVDSQQLRRRGSDNEESSDSFLADGDEHGRGGYHGVSSIIQKMFGYNPNKYRDVDDEDDRNMEVGFSKIQAEERRSAKIAKEEDDRELALIEEEERRSELARKKRKLK